MKQLGQFREATCPVSFWRFAAPVLVGNLAAWGAAAAARQAFSGDHPTTQKTAAVVTGIAAFWLIGGLAWVALSRKPA